MNAIIISVGDELVLGQIIDTNSAWLSQQLAAAGCDVLAHLTVGDNQIAIENAIRSAVPACDFLLISGGIGPTPDDLSRQALAEVMGAELELNANWLANLEGFFEARGRPMPEMNRIQAMIPRGATIIGNTCGTAAGIHAVLNEKVVANAVLDDRYFRIETTRESRVDDRQCHVFVMPGVPKEMKVMFHRDVLPHIEHHTAGASILCRTLHTFGLGESWVAERLGDLMRRDRNPTVGTTVSQGIVSVRINARFASREETQRQLDDTTRRCQDALGDLIFGADGQTLQEATTSLLKPTGLTIATAESCTGGLLARMLTDVSGSSRYFHTGFITYSNDSKHVLLGVPRELIAQHGAVSESVVQAMAEGARERAPADLALAISGVAGPTGGTPNKPVGTVCIALADPGEITARTFNFPGDREMIRDRSAKMALTMLRFHLLGKPLPF